MSFSRLRLLALSVLGVGMLGVAWASAPATTPAAASAAPTLAPSAPIPALPPGQVQPVAPGTRTPPKIPTLTLTPAIPQVHQVQYLGNGFIEVAHAIVTVTPQERINLRPLALQVAQRVLEARPSLNEVDISIYAKSSYAGFGGPLPLMTASVPRMRLGDFGRWVSSKVPYERVWVNPGNLPAYRAPDRVREVLPPTASELVNQKQARLHGGVVGGLLYRGKDRTLPIAALTFDDAPHPMYEPLLLDVLRRSGNKATFFVIGRNAAAYPYFIRDMVEARHEIANHTYHHVRLSPLSPSEASAEMHWANQILEGITHQKVRYFRPPGGEYTPQTLAAARSLGLTTVFWTDDPGDFQNPGEMLLESRLRNKLRPGGIVLLHDNAPQMLQVLQSFLSAARHQGYSLTTVGGLPK